MTRPGRPRSIMPGPKTCVPRITPQRLTSITRCQFSAGPNTPLPCAQVLDTAHIGLVHHDVAGAASCDGGDLPRGALEPVHAEVGDRNVKTKLGKTLRGGKADAGGAAGYDRDMAGSKSRMGHRRFSFWPSASGCPAL